MHVKPRNGGWESADDAGQIFVALDMFCDVHCMDKDEHILCLQQKIYDKVIAALRRLRLDKNMTDCHCGWRRHVDPNESQTEEELIT